jgi:transposase-like protein
MARPPSGPELVEGLEGSPEAKERLKVILETIAGTKTIAEACEQLGIGEAAFHKLRTRHLEEAVAGLEPRKPGRKPNEASEADEARSALEEKVKSLERELQATRIREKIALTMPHLFKRGKKNEND